MRVNTRLGPINIRWLIRCDMPEVLALERAAFEFPWTQAEFIRCVRQRNCIGMVAEYAERVVGFMVYELHKTRAHLLNVVVASHVRRYGVGRKLLEVLIGRLTKERNRITLEVRETNLAAQMFFRAVGFYATKVLSDWYDNTDEDAYFMQYDTSTPVTA